MLDDLFTIGETESNGVNEVISNTPENESILNSNDFQSEINNIISQAEMESILWTLFIIVLIMLAIVTLLRLGKENITTEEDSGLVRIWKAGKTPLFIGVGVFLIISILIYFTG